MSEEAEANEQARPELFVISDGTGETAAASVRAAMSQFPTRWRLRTFGEVRRASQIRRVLDAAVEAGALVVFTLVHEPHAEVLRREAAKRDVPVLDLLGPLIQATSRHFALEPQHRPGTLHAFTDEYFKRVEAVEFAVRHDDGANLHTLHQADIVLTGVSRTSKTPLSMYLAQRGFKTGNVPLVLQIDPPQQLLEVDPRKVFGLVVDVATLLGIRKERLRQLQAPPRTAYADPDGVADELRKARRLFRARGWRSVDITGRAVEENASRILELYERP
ncbi:MAG: pyruvate, water dikinase regulatory protein [Myxococcota bacterium]|nr:pyruvate, water dikinase regulatory protein [Myxococcota bacterium]